MMAPMSEFMPSAKASTLGGRVFVHVDHRAIAIADDLRLATDEFAILNFRPDTKCDSVNINIAWVGDSEFTKQDFGWTHLFSS